MKYKNICQKDKKDYEVIRWKTLVIYIHGKGGNIEETNHYQSIFRESDVIGFNYKSQTPWEAEIEFPMLYDRCANRMILLF